jgi:hypothetical protein
MSTAISKEEHDYYERLAEIGFDWVTGMRSRYGTQPPDRMVQIELDLMASDLRADRTRPADDTELLINDLTIVVRGWLGPVVKLN